MGVTLDKTFGYNKENKKKVRRRKQNFNSKISLPQLRFREQILNTGRVKVDKI